MAAPQYTGDPANLLWDGGRALIAGAVSEAVAHFAAAQDRAGEQYVRAICRERGLSRELVDAAWAGLASGAGQRTGALSIVYLIDTGSPLDIDAGMTQLRNRLAHQDRKLDLVSLLGPLAARVVKGARTIDVHESARASRRRWREREGRQYGAYAFSLVATIRRALEGRPGAEAADALPGLAACRDRAIDPAWSFDDFLEAVNRAMIAGS